MGRDKATIVVGGASLAERAAAALRAVAAPVLAVGPEAGTTLEAVADPRQGPLVAFDYGSRALADRGHTGPVFLLACDMPFVAAEMLRALAAARRGADAAVPIVDGHFQPLAAVYAGRACDAAARLVEAGSRSMRDLLAALTIEVLPAGGGFSDLDTPEDLARAAGSLAGPT